MSADLLKAYLKLVLEEKLAEEPIEEMGAASGGGNAMSAGNVAGFTAPLGSKPNRRKSSRRLTKSKK
jgi:hypothetical protein